jgi:hypothetical protein
VAAARRRLSVACPPPAESGSTSSADRPSSRRSVVATAGRGACGRSELGHPVTSQTHARTAARGLPRPPTRHSRRVPCRPARSRAGRSASRAEERPEADNDRAAMVARGYHTRSTEMRMRSFANAESPTPAIWLRALANRPPAHSRVLQARAILTASSSRVAASTSSRVSHSHACGGRRAPRASRRHPGARRVERACPARPSDVAVKPTLAKTRDFGPFAHLPTCALAAVSQKAHETAADRTCARVRRDRACCALSWALVLLTGRAGRYKRPSDAERGAHMP